MNETHVESLPDKVMNCSIDHSEWQGVFLVEEDAKEDGIGAAVVHFSQLGDGGG